MPARVIPMQTATATDLPRFIEVFFEESSSNDMSELPCPAACLRLVELDIVRGRRLRKTMAPNVSRIFFITTMCLISFARNGHSFSQPQISTVGYTSVKFGATSVSHVNVSPCRRKFRTQPVLVRKQNTRPRATDINIEQLQTVSLRHAIF